MTDRDKFIELFSPFADGTYNGSGTIVDGTKVEDVVDHLLANGVIVQKQGKLLIDDEEIGIYSCSICNHRMLRAKCNYCPECGAKLKELKDNA